MARKRSGGPRQVVPDTMLEKRRMRFSVGAPASTDTPTWPVAAIDGEESVFDQVKISYHRQSYGGHRTRGVPYLELSEPVFGTDLEGSGGRGCSCCRGSGSARPHPAVEQHLGIPAALDSDAGVVELTVGVVQFEHLD